MGEILHDLMRRGYRPQLVLLEGEWRGRPRDYELLTTIKYNFLYTAT